MLCWNFLCCSTGAPTFDCSLIAALMYPARTMVGPFAHSIFERCVLPGPMPGHLHGPAAAASGRLYRARTRCMHLNSPHVVPLQFCGPSNAFHLRLWPLPGFSRATASSKKQKTVLIMMSNTGGGHKASAEALAQAFQEKYGDKYRVRAPRTQDLTKASQPMGSS